MPSESDSTSLIDYDAMEDVAKEIAESLKPGRWVTPHGAIKAFRAYKGQSLMDITMRTGIGSGRLSEYEHGKTVPKIDRFIDLIEAMGGTVVIRRGTKEWRLRNE